jgi:ribosome-associated heat shock protein Hsp15
MGRRTTEPRFLEISIGSSIQIAESPMQLSLFMRLDQWLWAVRLYKTRTWAANAVKAGHVTVNGQTAKPAREVRAGELIAARTGNLTRTLRVLDAPPSRVGAKLVGQFAEDLTPPEEYERAREVARLSPLLRPSGTGRPTKKQRRQIEEFGF